MVELNITLILSGILVFCVGLVLSIPMLSTPLSEDDGNWFYQAVFWKRGVRPYKNLFNQSGYFTVQWVFAKLYTLFGFENPERLNLIKAIWYALNAVSVCILVQCLWHDVVLSSLAGIVFSMAIAVPNTLYRLTYGEHTYILPENLSIAAAYLGVTHASLPLIGIAGLLSAWAFQMKPTVFLFSCILSLSLFLSGTPLAAFVTYWIFFMILTLLPLVMIRKYGPTSCTDYLRPLFGHIVFLSRTVSHRLHLSVFDGMMGRVLQWLNWKDGYEAYIDKHYAAESAHQWLHFRSNFEPAARDLRIVILLALVQVATLAIAFDPMVVVITSLLLVALATIFLQKNYYTPHLNPLWVPLSILAAKSIWDTGPYLLHSGTLGLLVMALLAFEFGKISRIHLNSFRCMGTNAFGFKSPWKDMTFGMARTMGEYIRGVSGETDRLLVWGDTPSVYVYSQRQSLDPRFLFIYANQGAVANQDELLAAIREQPPEFIQFFNWKIRDGWNMQRLERETSVPYTLIETFRITNAQGKAMKAPTGILCEFPLYRRNDALYREILLDRALAVQRAGSIAAARDRLTIIVRTFPDFHEAALRLTLLDLDPSVRLAKLEKTLETEADRENRPVILRMIADAHREDEHFEKAADLYAQAVFLNPRDFRSLNALGEIIFVSGDAQRAEALFHDAHTINPRSADVMNNLGVMCLASGMISEAERFFSSALASVPEHADARDNLSQLSGGKADVEREREDVHE